jgi:hypothetical protein
MLHRTLSSANASGLDPANSGRSVMAVCVVCQLVPDIRPRNPLSHRCTVCQWCSCPGSGSRAVLHGTDNTAQCASEACPGSSIVWVAQMTGCPSHLWAICASACILGQAALDLQSDLCYAGVALVISAQAALRACMWWPCTHRDGGEWHRC